MTDYNFLVALSVAVLAIAAVFVTLGWLLNRPTTSKRLFHRFVALLLGDFLAVAWITHDEARHHWLGLTIDLAAGFVMALSAVGCYMECEKLRTAERAQSAPVPTK